MSLEIGLGNLCLSANLYPTECYSPNLYSMVLISLTNREVLVQSHSFALLKASCNRCCSLVLEPTNSLYNTFIRWNAGVDEFGGRLRITFFKSPRLSHHAFRAPANVLTRSYTIILSERPFVTTI